MPRAGVSALTSHDSAKHRLRPLAGHTSTGEAPGAGALVISGAAHAELAIHCPDRVDPDRLLAHTGIGLEPSAG